MIVPSCLLQGHWRQALGLGLLFGLVVALFLNAGAGSADGRVHTFKALPGSNGVTHSFRLAGLDAAAIVDARLVGARGERRVKIALVRRAARSRGRILRVRIAQPSSRKTRRTISRLQRARVAASRTTLRVTTDRRTTIAADPADGSWTTYTVPDTIASNCSTDVTSSLLSWIASVPENSVLAFTASGCYRIDGVLDIRGRANLTFDGKGATFRAVTKGGSHRGHWRIVDSRQITMRNMTVVGAFPARALFDPTMQWQHGYDFRGVAGVVLDRAHAESPYGDCVYLGQGYDSRKAWTSDVTVRESHCRRPGRMGVAVTAARNVLVERGVFDEIGLSAFNVEPNGAGWGADDIVFADSRVGRVRDYVFITTGTGPVNDVTVRNNTITGKGMRMGVFAPVGERRSNFTIVGNTSDTGYYESNAAAINFVRADGITVTGNVVPLSGPDMAAVSARESCSVSVRNNSYPGGVEESRISAFHCR